jgi:hypothetical protein
MGDVTPGGEQTKICAYCSERVPQSAHALSCTECPDVHEEVAHMLAAHPDIVAERLRAAGIQHDCVRDHPNRSHLEGQKEDLMVALREEGFELAAAMRMIDRRDRKLAEAKLLAEHWIRSSDNRTRRLGADLKQVLDG